MYDLLNGRARLVIREDARAQMCVVGLKEFEVADVGLVEQLIAHGTAARCVGSTGANAESSRSHAIMQFVLKKSAADGSGSGSDGASESGNGVAFPRPSRSVLKTKAGEPRDDPRQVLVHRPRGVERGADTSENDRQTRWRRNPAKSARFERMHPLRGSATSVPRPSSRRCCGTRSEFKNGDDRQRLAGERLVRAHAQHAALRLPVRSCATTRKAFDGGEDGKDESSRPKPSATAARGEQRTPIGRRRRTNEGERTESRRRDERVRARRRGRRERVAARPGVRTRRRSGWRRRSRRGGVSPRAAAAAAAARWPARRRAR